GPLEHAHEGEEDERHPGETREAVQMVVRLHVERAEGPGDGAERRAGPAEAEAAERDEREAAGEQVVERHVGVRRRAAGERVDRGRWALLHAIPPLTSTRSSAVSRWSGPMVKSSGPTLTARAPVARRRRTRRARRGKARCTTTVGSTRRSPSGSHLSRRR